MHKSEGRKPLPDILEEVLQCETLNPPLLIIDNLHKLRLSELDLFLKLAEKFTVLGAADEQPPKLKNLWWKLKTIEVHPLNIESSKHLIEKLTQHMTVADPEHLQNRLLTLSNGNPLAIVDMVKQLGYTTLGQAKLMTESEHQANEDKKEGLQSQIDETQLAIEELKFKMKKREFLFSGDVTLRRVTQLTKEATPHATN
jgi:replication-associated recombination protein RarA